MFAKKKNNFPAYVPYTKEYLFVGGGKYLNGTGENSCATVVWTALDWTKIESYRHVYKPSALTEDDEYLDQLI